MNRRTLALAAIALTVAACASKPTIKTDVAPGANFAQYRTYSWISSGVPAGMDPVIGARIRSAVDSAMTSKGYTLADPGPGDLSMAYTVGAQEKTDVSTYGAFGRGLNVYQYTQGRLTVDAFDSKTQAPVWHGSATQQINPGGDPAKVDGVVAQVMAKFPPRT
jgi:hypothetical protein